jgi:phenylacetate-CoA ligase
MAMLTPFSGPGPAKALLPRTPLDGWISGQISARPGELPLAPALLDQWQDEKKQALLRRLRAESPFYRSRLASIPDGPCSHEQWQALPLTSADDLRRHGPDMLCVSCGEVSRVTTLPTSGTSGPPKRMCFTRTDLERTVDFFHHGMSTFTQPGQTILVCMPGDRPDSIGDLLRQALSRLGCRAVLHGLAPDPLAALRSVVDARADVIVGLPVQVLAMARHPESALGRRLRAVLLSADHVAQAVRQAVEQAFDCPVFAHWGMTETGYGGGVECAAQQGYHLRGADLLVEIIDPDTGRVLPDGLHGEVVITTLTAQAMPLLRYRTGDLASLRTRPCACGSRLPRLGPILGRLRDQTQLGDGTILSLAELDEALLALPWLVNFQAVIRRDGWRRYLDLELLASPAAGHTFATPGSMIRHVVETALTLDGLLGPNRLELGQVSLGADLGRLSDPVKRGLRILDPPTSAL